VEAKAIEVLGLEDELYMANATVNISRWITKYQGPQTIPVQEWFKLVSLLTALTIQGIRSLKQPGADDGTSSNGGENCCKMNNAI
jgi:hypothetical protein